MVKILSALVIKEGTQQFHKPLVRGVNHSLRADGECPELGRNMAHEETSHQCKNGENLSLHIKCA